MVSTLLVALALALPEVVMSMLLRQLWYVVPALLITSGWPSQDERQTFARGALATFAAITLGKDSYSYTNLAVLVGNFAVIAFAGWLSVRLRRGLPSLPTPPPIGTSPRSGP